MTQPTKPSAQRPGPSQPTPAEAAKQQQEKAETEEVAGRHRNSGQKDHEGAR